MVAMIEIANRRDSHIFTYFPTVNSPPVPHRDISGSSASTYRPYNEEYAAVQHHIERPLEVEAERSKKDKKWSIGKLFRRKKKEEDSESSSQSDDGVSGISPSKRKSKKKKRPPLVNNFDHIVIRDTRRAQSVANPSIRNVKDDGILSDPSADFLHYKNKSKATYKTKDYLDLNNGVSRLSTTVLETPPKKKRKSRLKARVEALRNSMRGESSSDEESLKSSNSSSIIRFRSEDSLMRSRDSSLNKKTRTARNERYIKRLSRDEENQLNKEAELLQQGYTKAEVEMLTRTPTSQSSGYGTCKRDTHNNYKSDQLITNDSKTGPMESESVSSFPSTQSYLSSINFNAKVNNDHINYSIQYPSNNLNKESHYANSQREGSFSNQHDNPENVLCVKFPLGNVVIPRKEDRVAPVPPPRDMQRKVVTPISMYYENNSIISDRNSSNHVVHGVPNNDFERIMRRSQDRTYGTSGLRRPISSSEDHIAIQNNEYQQHYIQRNEQPRRPASVSAEPNHYGDITNSPPWIKRTEQASNKTEHAHVKQDYLYYADQNPRSRRPISIKSGQNVLQQNQYLSDSQQSLSGTIYRKPRNATDFWKKIDDAERLRQQQGIYANSFGINDNTQNMNMHRSFSERTKPTCKLLQNRADSADLSNRNKSFDIMDGAKIWKATTEYKQIEGKSSSKPDISPTQKTHIRHKSDTFLTSNNQMVSDDEKSSERRKSTNLDDALNELEAIYNSLGLGDEDLLDRAERRELMTPKFNDHFNDWNGNDDDVQLRSQPTTPLRRISRRSTLPDKLQDDMAFRRMNSFSNKEKPNNIKEAQSQISYMLASPVYVPYASDDDKNSERNEPDIIYDDVVYRNIKQTNNRLKTMDPQPPFGIPVGPISPAPQSDYLHATPENKGRSRFIPKKSPDIVADDLAYRSLRKDNRNSSLFNGEEYNGLANNNSYTEFPFTKESISSMKKKRAVRSLSANIFNMIHKEIDEAINMGKSPTLQKTNSNSDVMRRLRETFENNDNCQREHYPRNKVKQRHNTVNLFANSTQTFSHNFTRDDSFIHTDDSCISKSSAGEKSKNSSPLNKSPQPTKRSSKDEFQHVLSMLAQEAMDTSNKLGVALAELDKNRNKSEASNIQNKITSSRQDFLNGLTEKSPNNNMTDRNEIKYCSNANDSPLIVNDIENQSRVKNTEDSLLVISDQIHKVKEQLKSNIDKDVSNIQSSENETTTDLTLRSFSDFNNPINTSSANVLENKVQTPIPKIYSSNPFVNNDEKVNEINEIKAFKELKDGIKDLIAGITEVNDKLFISKKSADLEDCETDNIRKEAELNDVAHQVLHKTVDTRNINTQKQLLCASIYENDLNSKKDGADSTEYNSSEELATIFKLDSRVKSSPPRNEQKLDTNQESRGDLNSPKLVKTMSQQLRRLSIDEGTSFQSTPVPTNVVPWRAKRHNSQNESKGNNQKSKRNWHDSSTLMLACSYTLMFTQHLADLDWLTLLGLLLAIVTIIAMLMI